MTRWDGWIGREAVQHDRLTPSLLTRFRAMLDSEEQGPTAPQGIHWLLCTPDTPTVGLDHDGHPLRSTDENSFMPPVPLPRRMWASSRMEFLAPIPVDAEVEVRTSIANITEKSGSTGLLCFVDVDYETRANGIMAVSERRTIVYREAPGSAAPAAGPDVEPDMRDWDWHRTLRPDTPLLFRYSALSFNSHRIHYDLPYAQSEEHYRGLVVHGPLIATLLLDLTARELGQNQLKRFSQRAQSAAFSGERLHLVGRQEGTHVTLAAIGSDGRTCMTANAEL